MHPGLLPLDDTDFSWLMLLNLVVGFQVSLCGEDDDGNGCIHSLHISLSICSLDSCDLGLNMKNTVFDLSRAKSFRRLNTSRKQGTRSHGDLRNKRST
jgi:hypothetical protein